MSEEINKVWLVSMWGLKTDPENWHERAYGIVTSWDVGVALLKQRMGANGEWYINPDRHELSFKDSAGELWFRIEPWTLIDGTEEASVATN